MALFQANPDYAFEADSDALFAKGVWKDPDTGLTWMRCALGQSWTNGGCQGKAASLSWKQAVLETNKLVYADETGWRLPSTQELQPMLAQQGNVFAAQAAYLPALDMYAGFWTKDHQGTQSSAVMKQDDKYVIQPTHADQPLVVYAVKSEDLKQKIDFMNIVGELDPTINSVGTSSSSSNFFDGNGLLYGIYGFVGFLTALALMAFVIFKKITA